MLILDDKAHTAAAATIANPFDDDIATSNPWVPEMFRVLEERVGHALPNLIVDRSTTGGPHR